MQAVLFCMSPPSRHLKHQRTCVCVRVCVEMNLSLSHTKHTECLCINSTIAQRATTLCHLTRLGSQSKCSQAVYCVLIGFLPCLQHTLAHRTHTGVAHCHFPSPRPPPFFFIEEEYKIFEIVSQTAWCFEATGRIFSRLPMQR